MWHRIRIFFRFCVFLFRKVNAEHVGASLVNWKCLIEPQFDKVTTFPLTTLLLVPLHCDWTMYWWAPKPVSWPAPRREIKAIVVGQCSMMTEMSRGLCPGACSSAQTARLKWLAAPRSATKGSCVVGLVAPDKIRSLRKSGLIASKGQGQGQEERLG